MKKTIILLICCFALIACSNDSEDTNKPLKGEKEVIEMIEDKIDYRPNEMNETSLFKRDGQMDKKVTLTGEGNTLIKQTLINEMPYSLFSIETKEEMEAFLKDEINAYKQLEGIDYEIDFFDTYYYEEIHINYDALSMADYKKQVGDSFIDAEEDRDFLYMIRDFVERNYHFLDD